MRAKILNLNLDTQSDTMHNRFGSTFIFDLNGIFAYRDEPE